MDYSVLIGFIIILAAVSGFFGLARTLLSNWRAGSRGHEESDAVHSKKSRDFETCFNDCMASKHWDPDQSDICRSLCRSALSSPLSA